MSKYEYIGIDVYDFKGENVLSSYALESTPLTFIPNLSGFDYVEVLWDFGDDTKSSSLTGKKAYTEPGRYVVNLTVYDCYSNALLSTESKIVEIKNYLDNTFTVDFENTDYYDTISWEIGKINGPILIQTYYPLNVDTTNIYYRISGSDSEYYFEDTPYKFRHLEKTYSFFEKFDNNFLQTPQFREIDKIETTNTEVYAKISGGEIINAIENDNNSFYVGLSGYKEVYFKDDSINKINIDIFFDRSYRVLNGVNNTKVSLSADIIDNGGVSDLTITSNGMDGEFYAIDSFNIDTQKFVNVKIPFVVKIKDDENYSVKNFPSLTATDISYILLSSDSSGLIDSSYYTINNRDSFYGSTRGTIIFSDITTKMNDVQLSANFTTINDQGSSYNLAGITTKFDIFPQNYLSIQKKNEDFDAKETFKELRFQEFLLDDEVLFEDFMGSIFGTLSSSYNTLGKRIYEKTSNFVENIRDSDRNELRSLISQLDMTGAENNIFDVDDFSSPEQIKRYLDLGSISRNKLIGVANKFRENFDLNGETTKTRYGTNLGDEIDTSTYTITAGIPIVALEKFSNNYSLLNTEQPVEYTTTTTFSLSEYVSDWGWPLVLPDNYTYSELEKYYIFFEYVDGWEGTRTDFSILFDSSIYDTLTSESIILDENGDTILSDPDGLPLFIEFEYNYKKYILDISLRDTLYQGLSLVQPS